MVKIRYAEYSDKEYWFSVDQHMPESEFEHKVQTKRAYILCLNDKPIGRVSEKRIWKTADGVLGAGHETAGIWYAVNIHAGGRNGTALLPETWIQRLWRVCD